MKPKAQLVALRPGLMSTPGCIVHDGSSLTRPGNHGARSSGCPSKEVSAELGYAFGHEDRGCIELT